ncbi:hypothetical protein GGR56DRAFT_273541 [Xylariaceae sp. FL0804]|nr:hypothetical protein GGR56DRAFT_273541 [Xylariaceae sp. FL0804]
MAKPTPFAAHHEPLHIFHDDMFEPSAPAPSISRAPMPSVGKHPSPPRRALQSSNANVLFNPPNGYGKQRSPFKAGARVAGPHFAPLAASHANKLNPVSILPPAGNRQATDSILKKQPLMSKFKAVAQRPPSMDHLSSFEKENVHPTIYPAPTPFAVDLEGFYQKAPGKRALLEAAPIKGSRPSKKAKTEESSLPPPGSFPPIHDDGAKPGHSYAQLIGMAILRAPNRRLTLSQIYKWISDNYSFYHANDAGWQNSIRHNLSLNKAFIKQERPKDDPGKGNYWAIEPGMEQQFIREKPSRKSAATSDNVPAMPMPPRLDYAHVETTFQDGLPSLPPVLPVQHAPFSQESRPLQAPTRSAPEVSSDATIPMSDNAGSEEQADRAKEHDGSVLESNSFSPLPATMHSSPPIPRRLGNRSNTPPPGKACSQSSASRKRTHKRKHVSLDASASVDDSGYISSLESSAMRPQAAGRLHSSGTGRPRIKRGRAEEEIARLRASSYDSPSKSRSYNFIPPSSSPFRAANDGQMLPPLTPAVKMKPPPKPPASVSPNTNLQIHRNNIRHMLNSPLRRADHISDGLFPWSPAFQMDDSSIFDFVDRQPDFGVFADDTFDSVLAAGQESPTKRPAKRKGLDRSQSANTLGDITSSVQNKSVTPAPLLRAPTPSLALTYDSPSKAFDGMSSPSKLLMQSPLASARTNQMPGVKDEWMSMEDFYLTHFVDEDVEDSGVDILQDFGKIGGSQNATIGTSKPSRPNFGRSSTSTF